MDRICPTIQEFCGAIIKIRSSQTVQLTTLQKATACVDIINSLPCVKQPAVSHLVFIQNSKEFNQLLQCIPSHLLDLISGNSDF